MLSVKNIYSTELPKILQLETKDTSQLWNKGYSMWIKSPDYYISL